MKGDFVEGSFFNDFCDVQYGPINYSFHGTEGGEGEEPAARWMGDE